MNKLKTPSYPIDLIDSTKEVRTKLLTQSNNLHLQIAEMLNIPPESLIFDWGRKIASVDQKTVGTLEMGYGHTNEDFIHNQFQVWFEFRPL